MVSSESSDLRPAEDLLVFLELGKYLGLESPGHPLHHAQTARMCVSQGWSGPLEEGIKVIPLVPSEEGNLEQ